MLDIFTNRVRGNGPIQAVPHTRVAREEARVSARERLAAAVALFLVLITVIFIVGPEYAQARLYADALNYWIMAEAIVRSGSPNVSLLDGVPPEVYAPVVSYLRAPIFWLTQDTAIRLAAIQLQNAFFLTLFATLSSIYLQWRGTSRKWLIFSPFLFCAIATPWPQNVLFLLSDTTFACLTMAALVLYMRSWRQRRFAALTVCGFVICLILAILAKFTAIAVLAYALVDLALRPKGQLRRQWVVLLGALGAAAVLVVFGTPYAAHYVASGLHKISPHAPLWTLATASLNFISSTIPSLIVPNYIFVYLHNDIANVATPELLHRKEVVWLLIGTLISALILRGAIRLRREALPEVAALLVCSPVFALIFGSALRYTAVFQAFFIRFFENGIGDLLESAEAKKIIPVLRFLGGLSIAIFVLGSAWQISRLWQASRQANTIYAAEERVLRAIAKQNDPVFVPYAYSARWVALLKLHGVTTSRAADMLAAGKRAYVIEDCERQYCAGVAAFRKTFSSEMKARCGKIDLVPVAQLAGGHMHALIQEVKSAGPCTSKHAR
ncbi:hypothetical protein FHS83_000243 [Rhizomicrobium palustre]|uniref:Glycosyltransferase RgtA/B/C/D-like domain-containing protein n=1 Tax=Rhizomicrobium palustre TaxID=189966 RepID=A0A846MUL5_9PROT|nr:hypothetical protein [Rhizomicrobium palustre]NIK86925.1 hypothetical protein [Rhizomicrobium palustre]